jgi:hypothetical protein
MTTAAILDLEDERALEVLAALRRVRSLITIEPLEQAALDRDVAPLARSCIARARMCFACRGAVTRLRPVAAVVTLEPLDGSGRLAVAALCRRCMVDTSPLRERLRVDLGVGSDAVVHPASGRA